MTRLTIISAIAATTVLLAAVPTQAQQGTTMAGPAQGQKADGSASTMPSAESGARGGAMSSGSMSSGSAPATGSMSGGSTATGGNVGGAAGRN